MSICLSVTVLAWRLKHTSPTTQMCPNRALPANLKEELGVIYEALTGDSLPEDSQHVHGSCRWRHLQASVLPDCVLHRRQRRRHHPWGDRDIPVSFAVARSKSKVLQLKQSSPSKTKPLGKYEEPVLSVSIAQSGTLYTMPFPVRSADWENRVNGDILDALLEESPDKIAENLASCW